MNNIAKHIKDIYIHAYKLKLPLSKLIYLGVPNSYNEGKGRASCFIEYYLIEKKNNDNNKPVDVEVDM